MFEPRKERSAITRAVVSSHTATTNVWSLVFTIAIVSGWDVRHADSPTMFPESSRIGATGQMGNTHTLSDPTFTGTG